MMKVVHKLLIVELTMLAGFLVNQGGGQFSTQLSVDAFSILHLSVSVSDGSVYKKTVPILRSFEIPISNIELIRKKNT